jgi:hypothetical protein
VNAENMKIFKTAYLGCGIGPQRCAIFSQRPPGWPTQTPTGACWRGVSVRLRLNGFLNTRMSRFSSLGRSVR